MTVCTNGDCRTRIPDDSWFCQHCGSERPDCIECGSGLQFHECTSCSAAPEAPCEECGARIDGSVRECPHCGYDAGADYEEKADSWTQSKLLVVGGGTVLLLVFIQIVVSIGSGLFSGIFQTGFTLLVWFFGLISVGLWLLIGGSVSVLSDSWGKFRQSQADRATAANIRRAELDNRSEEYEEELRRERERERQREEKRREQRHKELVQCPNCGKLVYMPVEGEVTDVKSSGGGIGGGVGVVNTALDSLGSDTTKECPRCSETVMVESQVA